MTSYVCTPLRLTRRYVFGIPLFVLLVLTYFVMWAQRGHLCASQFVEDVEDLEGL